MILCKVHKGHKFRIRPNRKTQFKFNDNNNTNQWLDSEGSQGSQVPYKTQLMIFRRRYPSDRVIIYWQKKEATFKDRDRTLKWLGNYWSSSRT